MRMMFCGEKWTVVRVLTLLTVVSWASAVVHVPPAPWKPAGSSSQNQQHHQHHQQVPKDLLARQVESHLLAALGLDRVPHRANNKPVRVPKYMLDLYAKGPFCINFFPCVGLDSFLAKSNNDAASFAPSYKIYNAV
ncbi:unnamed protein product [Notodromas monacha]|uniref:TGF-beta propeptide domain-containing protein n=1 Tax=Notodromas monacha TaxID=399045 RepID=A0A7R9BKD1_9CRUS|nr:unnamed protein product [Notodromas monacha]CAG0916309.1 unnamed protein product [Notodromas monacha]